MTPSASIQKTDGNLSASADTERILAIIGPAKAGALNSPQGYTSTADVEEEFEGGPLVEAACYMIGLGIPVVLCRSTAATAGAYGAVDDDDVDGTATVTAGATEPEDDYDVIVEILTGGALGTAGITFRFSLDAGVNWSEEHALGTSLTLTCENGVSFTLASATNTLVAGDRWTCTTTAPESNASNVDAAQDAFVEYDGEWLRMLVLAEGDATMIAQCELFAKSFHAEGKYPEVIINTRPRGIAETRPTYQAAMATVRNSVQTTETSVAVDQIEMVSRSAKRLRKPFSIPYAARLMTIDESQDASAKALGALPGVFITSADGSRKYHDERKYPGLDVLGFTTARTWGGRPKTPGVFVDNPRLLSGPGSDFRYFQHSAILNRIIESAFSLVEPKLSMAVLVDTATGRLREDVARSIEETVTAELRTKYSDPGRVSGVRFTLSRTDNILSTDTVTFNVAAVPLGYVKKFVGKAGLVRTLPNAA